MSYSVRTTKKAEKQIRALPESVKKKIGEIVDVLKNEAIPARRYDVKKIKGRKNIYRIRVGSYRMLYLLDENRITILLVLHRSKAYEKI